MIIVEGCDGSGKTGLIRRLSEGMNLPIHERAVDDVTGPRTGTDLYEWARDDVLSWAQQPFALYDRHPLVSEFIYGPITRGTMSPEFHTEEARGLVRQFAWHSVIVFCDPGTESMMRNIDDADNMDGVKENAQKLIMAYRSFFTVWPVPLRVVRWNYNTSDIEGVKKLIQVQQASHERNMFRV